MVRGDASMGIGGWAYQAMIAKEKGVELQGRLARRSTAPTTGRTPTPSPLDAPNIDNAYAFIDFMTSPESNAAIATELGSGCTVEKAFDLMDPRLSADSTPTTSCAQPGGGILGTQIVVPAAGGRRRHRRRAGVGRGLADLQDRLIAQVAWHGAGSRCDESGTADRPWRATAHRAGRPRHSRRCSRRAPSTPLFFAVPMLCLLVLSFWTAKGFDARSPTSRSTTTQKIVDVAALSALLAAHDRRSAFVTACVVVPIAFALAYLHAVRLRAPRPADPAARPAVAVQRLPRAHLRLAHDPRQAGAAQLDAAMARASSTQPLEFLIYSNFAVVVTLIGLLLPLAVLPIYSAMANVLARPSRGGARPRRRAASTSLRTILVPMALPGVAHRLRLRLPARRR